MVQQEKVDAKTLEEAVRLHRQYRGKIQTAARCVIRSADDFALYYTPGVSAPCRRIEADPLESFELTCRWNTIAIVTDGTRVLGMGNIGPAAAMPVMEGKALLFKYLGGVDAVPICLATDKEEEICQAVRWLEPSFGGINLEDIQSPKCFRVLDHLRATMSIPVWHDDQQGTATVTLAGLINALKVVGKPKDKVTMAMVGSGAANVAVLRLLFAAGFKPEKTRVVDSKGILHRGRKDLEEKKEEYADKWRLCQTTNPECLSGGIAEALKGADVCVAMSRPGPGVVKPEWVKGMARDAIVFACANPTPEIWPHEAKAAGARVIATGRSDFPNQVNNSTGFPAIFRGALDVRAKTITDEMCIAAANALAKVAEQKGLRQDYITPLMQEVEAFVEEAVAVGMEAQRQGVAQVTRSERQLRESARALIAEGRRLGSGLSIAGTDVKAVAS